MRILHVAPTRFGIHGLYGGGERYPLELARALAREVPCELVTFGERPGIVREPMGLTIRTLRPFGYLHGHPAHPFAPELPLAARGGDIVHTHHMRSTPSRMAALTARATGRRVVVTDHGLQGSDWGGLLPRLFDRFLLVSACSAHSLRAPPSHTRLVYGGADPERFAPDPARSRDGVLFVGRLTPHKGVDRLIEALPPGARLRVAGTGGHDHHPPERDYPRLLQRSAAERDVVFLGAVPDHDLPSLYRQAVVLALPSVTRTCYGREVQVSELLGLVAIEAMASGTPVIASRLGGLSEVIQHGETGYLVEPGDVGEWRERLSELLGNPRLAAEMGRKAREVALERFTWRACAQRCLAAYQELMPSA